MSGPKHLESEAPANEHQFVRITPDSSEPGERLLANEVPAAIEFDGTPYAVMMLSPIDLEDFAVGFALSERIVSSPTDIARIDIRHGTRGTGIDIRLEKEHSQRLVDRHLPARFDSGDFRCTQ